MRKIGLILSWVISTLAGINNAHAKQSESLSPEVESVVNKWQDAERQACQAVLNFADSEVLTAQDIVDYQMLLRMLSQISDQPIEYCDSLLMENMVFGKPEKR